MTDWLFGFISGAFGFAVAQGIMMWWLARPTRAKLPDNLRIICPCQKKVKS